MKKCLVIDLMHESLFPMLEKIGWTYDYKPNVDREEIKKIIRGYDGLIVRSKTHVDADLLGEDPTVKFIGRAGAGVDNLDLGFLEKKSIAVLHAAEGNRDAVGEFTLGALLSLMRNLPRADQQVKSDIWKREENRGEELMGKTVGIIGYGNMGQAFARRLSGFECKVLAYDKYKSGISDQFATQVPMEALFEEADILSLHIPLTNETRGMIKDTYIDRYKKQIIFINTARGEIASFEQLHRMLESGKIRGAVLDVLENEKLANLSPVQRQYFNLLKERSNVILTPHIAGWTFESHVKINVALVEKIAALRLV